MKLSKNTLIAASMTIAIALGCANFMDTTLNAPQAASAQAQTEIAKANINNDLFYIGGAKPDVIIVKPD